MRLWRDIVPCVRPLDMIPVSGVQTPPNMSVAPKVCCFAFSVIKDHQAKVALFGGIQICSEYSYCSGCTPQNLFSVARLRSNRSTEQSDIQGPFND